MEKVRKAEILGMVRDILVPHTSSGDSYICHALESLKYGKKISSEECKTVKEFIIQLLSKLSSVETWLKAQGVQIGDPYSNKIHSIRVCNYRKSWLDHLIAELKV